MCYHKYLNTIKDDMFSDVLSLEAIRSEGAE